MRQRLCFPQRGDPMRLGPRTVAECYLAEPLSGDFQPMLRRHHLGLCLFDQRTDRPFDPPWTLALMNSINRT
jgi:hypothetical protein